MKTIVRHPIILCICLLWIGFICAISFMEAWLKFQAPGITISLGLGIGRLVFAALNKVEWIFVLIIAISFSVSKELFTKRSLPFWLCFFLLLIQTIWLLPILDSRAEMYINGENPRPSFSHYYYIIIEVLKVILLSLLATLQCSKANVLSFTIPDEEKR